jgi:hypothetical protein
MHVAFFCVTFIQNIFRSENNTSSPETRAETDAGLRVKCPAFLLHFKKYWNASVPFSVTAHQRIS